MILNRSSLFAFFASLRALRESLRESLREIFLWRQPGSYFAYSNDKMSLSLEERKLQYIQRIESEYLPVENSWWQHPPPVYRLTRDYAAKYHEELLPGEPVIFKKAGKERTIVAVMMVVAFLLLYLVGRNEFGLIHILFLLLLLIVVLPVLLNNKTMMRVSRDGIWLYKDHKDLRWEQVLLTYIKEVHEENTQYFFIVHYYDAGLDEFRKTEIELDGLVSPEDLSATIERYRLCLPTNCSSGTRK
ncbi:MAG: hypothetical protein JWM28_2985 [Chitinophagaceae bacterium]|nr:hypothetical protein [Chitinophagaceae bacterium]